MIQAPCLSAQAAQCGTDKRRAAVRASCKLGGLDYVEVAPNGTTLVVHFFGAIPEGLTARNVVIEGGRRIREIRVLSANFVHHEDGDACLHVTIDKPGDFSPYCICLIEPADGNAQCLSDKPVVMDRTIPVGIDPRYACASFLFRTDCAATTDCKPQPCPAEPTLPAPAINYLARDFQSFRQLMLDRLLVTMPQWRERHIPDIGITLVELMAYVADHLSYGLDAVATEAYLATARLRISVRRHARLVDYRMHEGCNSRAWVAIESDIDQTFEISDLAFGVTTEESTGRLRGLVDWEVLRQTPGALIFEPIDVERNGQVSIVAAHSEIHFYTWTLEECCLPAGSTRASFRDDVIDADPPRPNPQEAAIEHYTKATPERPLHLKAGDVLILEEIRGPRTGALADADPDKRHVVRLTHVTKTVDPLSGVRVLEVEWGQEDALPFTLCLSTRTDAPHCEFAETAMARGNLVLVDHGVTLDEVDNQWVVQEEPLTGCCGCEGAAVDVTVAARPFSMTLPTPMLTHAEILDENRIKDLSASSLLQQDPRKALPVVTLDDGEFCETGAGSSSLVWRDKWDWISRGDLLSSLSSDLHFVVEIDDEGFAHLRFGDNDCGWQPKPGLSFRARQRIGNGTIGNVGRDAIVCMARKNGLLSGIRLRPRNPLPAMGGTAPEPVSHVKLYAPQAYSRVIERAVAADDYAELAARDERIDSTYAELAWNGSWYEAAVALDPLAKAEWDTSVARDIELQLSRVRRIGHDLRIARARKVPLIIGIDVCVAPRYSQGDVELAVREVLSNRRLADGALGLFHPDNFEFGTDIKASRVVTAVQKIEGVLHVEIKEFRRQDTPKDMPSPLDNSFADNFIVIGRGEIAQLDDDRNFPENGFLNIGMMGGL